MNIGEFRKVVNGFDPTFDDRPLYVAVHGGVGPSSVVDVTGVAHGFDWDHGRVFVNVSEELVKLNAVAELITRDFTRRPRVNTVDYAGTVAHRNVSTCVMCGGPLELDFKFCPHCGQRLERR